MATSVEPQSETGSAVAVQQTQPTAETAVAKSAREQLPADIQQQIQLNKLKNDVAAAIRGTIWGKDLNAATIRAVAEYARENNIDAVRHIEVLGGKIYLTAELYEERGAPLMQARMIIKAEPDYINVDERLDKLAATGDTWAKEEVTRRSRERIRWRAPEEAKAIVVQKLYIAGVDRPIVGVNWCGGTSKRDPVGDAEPTKTAASRAARRAWKQIVEVIPQYGAQFQIIEQRADSVNGMIIDHDRLAQLQDAEHKPRLLAQVESGEYGS